MAFDSVPWVIGGGPNDEPGPLISGEVARLLPYALSGGAHGVVLPGDLKGAALEVPAGAVRIAPGGVLIGNRYPGGARQSYIAMARTETEVPIEATGSAGGRSDMVVARVTDPQYEGAWPEDVDAVQYAYPHVIEDVPPGARTVDDLPSPPTWPCEEIMRVDLPASTGTVTGAMITDLRRVALPRKERTTRMDALGGANVEPLNAGDNWEIWPNMVSDWWNSWRIPEWATRANVQASWGGVRVPPSADRSGYVRVQIAVDGVGAVNCMAAGFDMPQGGSRQFLHTADNVPIPEEMRGKIARIRPQGRYTAPQAGGDSVQIWMDVHSTISVDIEFLEQAS